MACPRVKTPPFVCGTPQEVHQRVICQVITKGADNTESTRSCSDQEAWQAFQHLKKIAIQSVYSLGSWAKDVTEIHIYLNPRHVGEPAPRMASPSAQVEMSGVFEDPIKGNKIQLDGMISCVAVAERRHR